jgi:hypothetical protein
MIRRFREDSEKREEKREEKRREKRREKREEKREEKRREKRREEEKKRREESVIRNRYPLSFWQDSYPSEYNFVCGDSYKNPHTKLYYDDKNLKVYFCIRISNNEEIRIEKRREENPSHPSLRSPRSSSAPSPLRIGGWSQN